MSEKSCKLLDVRRVEHHSDAGTEAVGRKVASELRFYNARVAVRASNTSPDYADFGAFYLLLCPVDICDPLAQVELRLLW